MISGLWLRIAPEQSSMPLQTMSYCHALMVERVLRLQRLEPALGHRERVVAEVDLLRLVVVLEHREVDDPAEARTRPRAITPSSWPTLVRAWPANFHAASGWSATKNTASPSSAPVSALELGEALVGDELGDRALPRAALERRCSPGPACPRPAPTRSACRRSCAAGSAALGARMARTTPPLATMPAKTLKSEPAKTSPTSTIRSGLRRSGLSVP